MVFITIPNHKTLSLTLDLNTTTLHSLKLFLHHHTHILIRPLLALPLPIPPSPISKWRRPPLPPSRGTGWTDSFRKSFSTTGSWSTNAELWSRNRPGCFTFCSTLDSRWGSICGQIRVRRSAIGLEVGWRERDRRSGFAYPNKNL